MRHYTAKEALDEMCHTSSRTWDARIYTIADARFPDYNGMKIKVALVHGKYTYSWTHKGPMWQFMDKTYEQIESMLHNGTISQNNFEQYCCIWAHGSPRLSGLNAQYIASPLCPFCSRINAALSQI